MEISDLNQLMCSGSVYVQIGSLSCLHEVCKFSLACQIIPYGKLEISISSKIDCSSRSVGEGEIAFLDKFLKSLLFVPFLDESKQIFPLLW